MWLTALIMGFAGSMHCLGMCSPLVMAVTPLKTSAVLNRSIYNAGRILVYGSLGAIVASAGIILPLHKVQNIVSIVLGLSLLALGLGAIKRIRIPLLTSGVQKLAVTLKKVFARYLQRKDGHAIFVLGALNGLLPCGLTFIALTWCLTLRGPLDGFNFMLMFGAGTLPVMLGLTSVISTIFKKLDWSIQRLSASMLIISGVVLIARVFLVHMPHTTSHGGIMEIMMCR
jgi:sulfite exporter TauE/SafE